MIYEIRGYRNGEEAERIAREIGERRGELIVAHNIYGESIGHGCFGYWTESYRHTFEAGIISGKPRILRLSESEWERDVLRRVGAPIAVPVENFVSIYEEEGNNGVFSPHPESVFVGMKDVHFESRYARLAKMCGREIGVPEVNLYDAVLVGSDCSSHFKIYVGEQRGKFTTASDFLDRKLGNSPNLFDFFRNAREIFDGVWKDAGTGI